MTSDGTAQTPAEVWLTKAAAVRVFSTGEHRAPHKPLLMLLATARLMNGPTAATGAELFGHAGGTRLAGATEAGVRFADVQAPLKDLLVAYGPPLPSSRANPRPEFPFSRLPGDGLWQLHTSTSGRPHPWSGAKDSAKQLREDDVVGSFPAELAALLRDDPVFLSRFVGLLLAKHFPQTLHTEILAAVGLAGLVPTYPSAGVEERRRSAAFRKGVIEAWDGQCAFCGYAGRLGALPVGLEAAHVRWFALAGPDDLTNGLCLCSLHHRLFDRGALGLADDLTILVSSQFTDPAPRLRSRVSPPSSAAPEPAHLAWHRAEVFRP